MSSYLDKEGLAYFWQKIKSLFAQKADIASPALTGTPTAPTAEKGTSTTQLATTEFVSTAINEQEILDAASGQIINITNAKAGAQVKTLTLLNGSGQELTGKSLVITNKNLFRIDLLPNRTTNLGVTFTKNADGSITAVGTSTGGYASTKCNIDKNAFVPGVVYSMSCGKEGGSLYVQLALTFTDNTTEYLVSSSNYTTFMVPKAVKSAVGSVQITASGTTVNQTVWPQIEIAGAATSFVNNMYSATTYPGGSMPTLPATVSNIYSNDDSVATIEVTYVQDVPGSIKVIDERTTNLELYSGSGGGSGTSDYNELNNKPFVNGVELRGNKSTDDLNIQEKLESGTNIKTINGNSILGPGNIVIEGGSGSGLTDEAKQALLNLFEKVAYTVDDAQEYYDALYDALYPSATLVSIGAEFNQGSTVIYPSTSLDSLKPMLTVTAYYDDSSTKAITNYTLSGALTEGTSTVTVTYEGKTATFTVTVSHEAGTFTITNTLVGATNSNSATNITEYDSYSATITASSGYTLTGATVSITMDGVDITSSAYNNGAISIASVTGDLVITVTAVAVTLSSITAVYTQSGAIYPDTPLSDLKSDLVVTAHYSDNTTATIPGAGYSLSGTLAVGTSTVTVTYSGKTTTFSVTVTEPATLTSISAVYTQSGTVAENTSLTSLKNDLVVTAMYSDSTTVTVPANDYTLSGTLQKGTSIITVTYQGKTTTFNVTVTWDFKWLASTASQTLPTGMTVYGSPTWGADYVDVIAPVFPISPYGDITWEIELAWENYRNSANTQFLASSGANTACKIFMTSNATTVNWAGHSNGSYVADDLGINGTEFHKYKMVLNGTDCSLYLDDVLVSTKQTYNSQYNGDHIIYSQFQTSQYQSHVKIKSIKYARG